MMYELTTTIASASLTSNNIALAAIIGGISSICANTIIEDVVDVLINTTQVFSFKKLLVKCVLSSLTIGLLLSIIFYAFAVYGFPNASITPIQIIGLFSLFVSFGFSLMDIVLQLIYSKLFV